MNIENDQDSESIVEQIRSLIDDFEQQRIDYQNFKQKLIFYGKFSGFIENDCRSQAWKYLNNDLFEDDITDLSVIEANQYYAQVKIDVIRTLKRFPPNYSDDERHGLQDELIVNIGKVLVKNTDLHYYQGYHDICLTILLVLGGEHSLPIINSITLSHLRYFMEPTMATTRAQLSYLLPLLDCINSGSAEYIQRGDVGHVIFALPWFITWYSHVLDDLQIILRLYDLFIVSHYLMPIYVAATIVDYKGEEIFKIDCEMSALHQYLSSLPTQFDMNDWNEIIQRALYLFENHPPETLDERQAQWQVKCDSIENSPATNNPRGGGRPPNRPKDPNPISWKNLSVIAFWSASITVGGLAIYLWNHSLN